MVVFDVLVDVLIDYGLNLLLIVVMLLKDVVSCEVIMQFCDMYGVVFVLNIIVFVVGVIDSFELDVLVGDVLVLQVILFGGNCDVWVVDNQGLYVCDIVMYIVLFEVDGCIVMCVVSFKGFVYCCLYIEVDVVCYQLDVEWIVFVVVFVCGWCCLCMFDNVDKCIVLIFVNYL